MILRLPARLSWKLSAAILPPVILAVSGIVWLQYNMARREMLVAINQQMGLLAETTAGNIDERLDESVRDLFTLSETSLITDYYHNVDFKLLDEAEAYRRELERYLGNFAKRSRGYARIQYLDAARRVVASGSPESRASSFPAGDFRQAAEAPAGWWISPVEDLEGVGPVLYYAKPVRDERGELKGMLVLGYDLANLRDFLHEIQVGKSGRAYILTSAGRKIEGRGLAQDRGLLVASRRSTRKPWTVFVEAPLEDFLGPLRSVKNAAVLTALLGVAILVGVLLLLVRSITRPIEALVAAARAIGAGDLSYRIAETGPDELGTLSNAFNEMAEHLDQNRERTSQLQSQLIQAEKLSAVGQLISSVAHELNNPLGAISGYVQLAQLESCPPQLKEDLEHIYHNVQRCRKVVDNLLFFVRQSRQERRKVDLNDAVQSALELLKYRLLKTEGVRVDQHPASPGPAVAGDFQQIVQIILNLIGNACDAMESGVQWSEGKILTIRTGADDGRAFIEIEDNGSGVSPDARERIFQPFFTTKEPGRGTGLGLPICRQIAQDHGGDVSARDGAGGRGSVFRLELPLGSAEEFDRISVLATPSALPAVPGKRVLVADDEEDIAEVIARLLREDGDSVEIARNGAEALKLLAGAPYDLVVTDIEMEHAKGTDLYAVMEGRGAFPATKVLFVTGDILNPKVLEFLTRTRSEYAVKPFDVQELRQTMRRLLAR